MSFAVHVATERDVGAISELIRASVRGLQPEYTEAQREAALRTVFTPDTRLIADGTYFIAEADGIFAGCGGWSFRKTLYGGDHHVEPGDAGFLDAAVDAAKVRAIFVHPQFARRGLGSLLLQVAEDAAMAAGFRHCEMGSTLAGLELYTLKGYVEGSRREIPVGDGQAIVVVRMTKQSGMAVMPQGDLPKR